MPLKSAERADIEESIDGFLNEKDNITRTIFFMRTCGYTYEEIGQRLKVSESTVRSVYFRTRLQLRRRLIKDGCGMANYEKIF